jgi:hypothetical protein
MQERQLATPLPPIIRREADRSDKMMGGVGVSA